MMISNAIKRNNCCYCLIIVALISYHVELSTALKCLSLTVDGVNQSYFAFHFNGYHIISYIFLAVPVNIVSELPFLFLLTLPLLIPVLSSVFFLTILL